MSFTPCCAKITLFSNPNRCNFRFIPRCDPPNFPNSNSLRLDYHFLQKTLLAKKTDFPGPTSNQPPRSMPILLSIFCAHQMTLDRWSNSIIELKISIPFILCCHLCRVFQICLLPVLPPDLVPNPNLEKESRNSSTIVTPLMPKKILSSSNFSRNLSKVLDHDLESLPGSGFIPPRFLNFKTSFEHF